MENFAMTENSMKHSDFPLGSRIILHLLDERGTSMALGLRILFAIAAIGTLFERAPWAQTQPIIVLAGIALPAFMATLAITGNAPGSSRKLCYFVGITATLLVIIKALYAPSV
jgi:hypothetical protein